MENLDYKMLFGDLNFRVDLDNDNVRAMIEKYKDLTGQGYPEQAEEVLGKILKYDQLNRSRTTNDVLEKYKEGQVTFLPTYKYDTYSNTYDSSSKQRVPSW